MNYTKKSPCNNCPYRKDAPLQYWSIEEFRDVLANEKTMMGTNYACHKKDGHVCVGFLMQQDENNIPSLVLRMSLAKHNVKREYLDSLKCKSPRFKTALEMAQANYPRQF